MTYRLTAGILVALLGGCPVGSADDDDGQPIDAGGDVDVPIGTSGLTVTWDVTPEVPGNVDPDLRVDEVHFTASSLRLIGDSAAPGDSRTTRAPIELRWRSEMGNDERPADIELNAAPSGLYSRLEIGTGGAQERLIIDGEVRLGGQWRDFEIDDERSHAIAKNIVLALAPGQHKTVPVTIDLATILAAVPFDDLPVRDGTIEYPEDDPRLDALWAAVDASLTLPTSFAE